MPSRAGVWSLAWSWAKPRLPSKILLPWQQVNHFSQIRELTRKDLLSQNIHRFRTKLGLTVAFCFIPETYVLPEQFVPFVTAFSAYEDSCMEAAEEKNVWILKPVGLSRGRGINIQCKLSDITYDRSTVVQKYIKTPYLLEGYKFDLRLYVLVTSFQPLECFLYTEGFVRVCSKPFDLSAENLSDRLRHLTNTSLNRASDDATPMNQGAKLAGAYSWECGSDNKYALPFLWRKLRSDGIETSDVEQLWSDIQSVVLKSLLACEQQIAGESNAFELLGYDILIDQSLKPWLIEVNSSPSLAMNTELDHRVKRQLLIDLLRIIDPFPFNYELLEALLKCQLGKLKNRKNRMCCKNPSCTSCHIRLEDILYGRHSRAFGELPFKLGAFQRLAPHERQYEALVRKVSRRRPMNSVPSKKAARPRC